MPAPPLSLAPDYQGKVAYEFHSNTGPGTPEEDQDKPGAEQVNRPHDLEYAPCPVNPVTFVIESFGVPPLCLEESSDCASAGPSVMADLYFRVEEDSSTP